MSVLVEIPTVIASKAMEPGIDVGQEVIEYLIHKLHLEPEFEARIHLKLADKLLVESRKLAERYRY